MALEDFTNYEVTADEGSDLTIAANSITWTTLPSSAVDAHVGTLKGSGYFDESFQANFKVSASRMDNTVNQACPCFTNSAGNYRTAINNAENLAVCAVIDDERYFILRTYVGGAVDVNALFTGFTLTTDYFITINYTKGGPGAIEGVWAMKIATGAYHADGGTLVDTLNGTTETAATYDYLYGFSSYDIPLYATKLSTGIISNLEISGDGYEEDDWPCPIGRSRQLFSPLRRCRV